MDAPQATPSGGDRAGRGWAALYAVLAVATILPGLVLRAPLCWDFWTHTARLALLGSAPDDPLHRFYVTDWSVIPNLAIDLAYAGLSPVLAPEAVMRLLWCAALLGPAFGVWLLNRVLVGRTEPTVLIAGLLLHNLSISGGQINYALGMAIGLITIALWLGWSRRPWGWRLLAFNGLAVLLFFCHAAALAVVLAVIGLVELGRGEPRAWARAARVPLFFLSGFGLALLSRPWETLFAGRASKAAIFVAPYYTGVHLADMVAAFTLAFGAYVLFRHRAALIHPAMRLPLAGLAVISIVLPTNWGAGAFLDSRVWVFTFLAGVGSLVVKNQRWAGRVSLACGAAALVKLALMMPVWSLYDHDSTDFRRLIEAVRPGSRVLVAMPDGLEACGKRLMGAYQHLPDLAVSERHSFVNTLATGIGMQPVHIRPELQDGLYLPWVPMEWTTMAATEQGRPVIDNERWGPTLGRWRSNFDYVINLHLGCGAKAPDWAPVSLVGEGVIADLYRVVRQGE